MAKASAATKSTIKGSNVHETHDAGTLRARLDTITAALAPGDVSKIPAHAGERADHVAKFAAAAAKDASLLVGVPLEDGALERWELDVLPVAAQVAKELGPKVDADRTMSGATLSAEDAKLLARVRLDQALLIKAFRWLRFRSKPARLRELRRIEAGEPGDVVDARDDSAALLALAEHDDHRGWVATLPDGESAAVARLRADHPRIEALAKGALDNEAAGQRREFLRRVWTMIDRIERRVRNAADYRFRGTAKRNAYNGYRRRAAGKKKTTDKAPKATAAPATKPGG